MRLDVASAWADLDTLVFPADYKTNDLVAASSRLDEMVGLLGV